MKFLVTTIPVNSEIKIPKIKVKAKPLTDPEVFKKDQSKGLNKIRPVRIVAVLASFILFQALPKASSKATLKGRPDLFSSLYLSKINILLSTAIPTDRIKPAIPGRLRVTGIILYNAKVNRPFRINPTDAIIPKRP